MARKKAARRPPRASTAVKTAKTAKGFKGKKAPPFKRKVKGTSKR